MNLPAAILHLPPLVWPVAFVVLTVLFLLALLLVWRRGGQLSRLRQLLSETQHQQARLQGEREPLQRQLLQERQQLDEARQLLQQRGEQLAVLQTRLDEQQRENRENRQLLVQAQEQLRQQLRNLAQDILDEKGRQFEQRHSASLQTLLSPLRDQLQEFRRTIETVHTDEVRERVSLKQQLEQLHQQSQRLNDEAGQLARALKGDNRQQGSWGELVLERLLEQSGLRQGSEYELQSSMRDADQRLQRPDVVVHLPEGRDLVIDSKVSLVAFERYCNAADAASREQALREHVAAVRQHIGGLAAKDYSALPGLRSLDFVLLFLPIEAALIAALQADPALFDLAFERRVAVVGPTTLLASLRTIEHLWRYERQNQNAQAIASRAGAIHDKLRGFVADMEKIGVQIAALDQSYQSAMGRLCLGKGNLISQAQRFVDLGVKVAKPLPPAILERAELEQAEIGPEAGR
jgi:DNA recombination protein RmuC